MQLLTTVMYSRICRRTAGFVHAVRASNLQYIYDTRSGGGTAGCGSIVAGGRRCHANVCLPFPPLTQVVLDDSLEKNFDSIRFKNKRLTTGFPVLGEFG